MVAGTSTLLMRHGQIVAFNTFGKARLGDGAALTRDAIFRIYSMTKPVTGVAMMILFEEGRWRLDDPVTDVLPELAGQKVFAGLGPDGTMLTQDAIRPPTIRELMSHTTGLGYGLFDVHPIERAYREAGVMMANSPRRSGATRRHDPADVRARNRMVLLHRHRPSGSGG